MKIALKSNDHNLELFGIQNALYINVKGEGAIPLIQNSFHNTHCNYQIVDHQTKFTIRKVHCRPLFKALLNY